MPRRIYEVINLWIVQDPSFLSEVILQSSIVYQLVRIIIFQSPITYQLLRFNNSPLSVKEYKHVCKVGLQISQESVIINLEL